MAEIEGMPDAAIGAFSPRRVPSANGAMSPALGREPKRASTSPAGRPSPRLTHAKLAGPVSPERAARALSVSSAEPLGANRARQAASSRLFTRCWPNARPCAARSSSNGARPR